MEKPKDLEQYKKWLDEMDCDVKCGRFEKYYENVLIAVREQFLKSPFWNNLHESWDTINANYYAKTGYNLFGDRLIDTHVIIKPYLSILDKTYRKNVIFNDNWPEPPQKNGEWLLLPKIFETINDCLRTTIIVKYLDGADSILDSIEQIAKKNGLETHHDYEAKDEGYYAIHEYIIMRFEIPDFKWDTKKIDMMVEIQITTQIQGEILSIVVDWKSERFLGHAAASSTRSPFTNLIPASTRGMNLNPSNLRQLCSASLHSL